MLNALIGCLAVIVAVDALPRASASENVAGTWVIILEGHQVGLGLEQDGHRVTGTLVVRGRSIPMEGEFKDRVLTLSDIATGGDTTQSSDAVKLTGTLKEDGTMEGEITSRHGRLTWTGERLKTQKGRV